MKEELLFVIASPLTEQPIQKKQLHSHKSIEAMGRIADEKHDTLIPSGKVVTTIVYVSGRFKGFFYNLFFEIFVFLIYTQ